MPALSSSQLNDIRAKAEAGDLSACDSLATHLYEERKYEESAALYLKALRGGFYKGTSRPESESNFFTMVDKSLISHTSEAFRFVQERRRLSADVTSRANRAAGSVGIAVFAGYLLLVFVGGVTGILRDFSLLIAGVLAWLAWKLVIASFESDA